MNLDADLQRFTTRANIARYQKILATHLTPVERSFVERRLKEENTTLQQFTGQGTSRAGSVYGNRSPELR
jgi:hypothetical protein